MLKNDAKTGLTVSVIVARAECAAFQPRPQVPEFTPKFAYSPAEAPTDTPPSFGTEVVVEPALEKHVLTQTEKNATRANFRNALSKQISVIGPVSALDELTFSEMKESHLG